jgi:hypothetical protein
MARDEPGKRLRAGCLAHARRKLFEQREQPETKSPLYLIAEVYVVEREEKAAGMVGTDAPLALRRQGPAVGTQVSRLVRTALGNRPRDRASSAISATSSMMRSSAR